MAVPWQQKNGNGVVGALCLRGDRLCLDRDMFHRGLCWRDNLRASFNAIQGHWPGETNPSPTFTTTILPFLPFLSFGFRGLVIRLDRRCTPYGRSTQYTQGSGWTRISCSIILCPSGTFISPGLFHLLYPLVRSQCQLQHMCGQTDFKLLVDLAVMRLKHVMEFTRLPAQLRLFVSIRDLTDTLWCIWCRPHVCTAQLGVISVVLPTPSPDTFSR